MLPELLPYGEGAVIYFYPAQTGILAFASGLIANRKRKDLGALEKSVDIR